MPAHRAPTRHAAYIGRIGALAVALGIGAAVASGPGFAFADPDSTSGAGQGDSAGGESTGGDSNQPDSGTPDTSEPSTAADAPATDNLPAAGDAPGKRGLSDLLRLPSQAVQGTVDALQVVVRDTVDRARSAPGAAADPDPAPVARSSASTPRSLPDAPDVPAVVADVTASLPRPDAAIPAAVAAVQQVAAPVLQTVSSGQGVLRSALVSGGGLTDPLPVIATAPDTARDVVTSLVAAALGPLTSADPSAPMAPSPALWALAAAARREFERLQRTFFNQAPVINEQLIDFHPANPTDVTAVTPSGATDPDGDALTYRVPDRGTPGGPQKGTVTIDPVTGEFTYNPDDDFARAGGEDSFTIIVSDRPADGFHFHGLESLLNFGQEHESSATVTVKVTRTTTAPVAADDSAVTAEDQPVTVAVLANDIDPDGDPLTPTVTTGPANGTAVVNAATGTIVYTPDENFNGVDSFTYTVSDGLKTDTATVTVTVTPVDDAPVAKDDAASGPEGTAIVIDVLANDTDVDGGPKVITAVTQPESGNGTVTYVGGTVTYTPVDPEFSGEDTFTYTLNGGSTATVTVTVSAVDDPPVAVDDDVTVDEGTTVVIPVTANDTDADGGAAPKVIAVTQPAAGSVTFTDTTVTFTPTDPEFAGEVVFTYTLEGGSTANVTVTVEAVDDPPVAVDDDVTATVGQTKVIPVTTNDTDVDGGAPPKVVAVTQPINGNGTVTLTDGVVSYTPTQVGTTSFTYTLEGGSTATVTVTVTAANTPPVIDSLTSESGIGNTWYVAVTSSDADGDALTTEIVSTNPAAPVTVTDLGDGWYEVVADPEWALANPGADVAVAVTVTDARGEAVTETLDIGTANNVLATGGNFSSEVNIPALPPGVTYTKMVSGPDTAYLFRSDGTVVALGSALPPPAGATYTDVDLGPGQQAVFITDDGQAVVLGVNDFGQADVPPLSTGRTYTQGAAGVRHSVLLLDSGQAVAFGSNQNGRTTIPPLTGTLKYTQVAAGANHTVLLRSDGQAFSFGAQQNFPVPALLNGMTYTKVAANNDRTVLLRSDGNVFDLALSRDAQSKIPPLPAGVKYTDVSVGDGHTVLLRSDGQAVAVGADWAGQSTIPTLPDGVSYTAVSAGGDHTLLMIARDTVVV